MALALGQIPSASATGRPEPVAVPGGPSAVGPDFRIRSILPPLSGTTASFEYATPDGAHVYIKTDAFLGPGDERNHVYDLVAGRVVPVARGAEHQFTQLDAATPDGRYAVLRSVSHLTPDDVDPDMDLYRVGPDGVTLLTPGADTDLFHVRAMISDDGSTVVLDSMKSLAPADGDTLPDLYRWRATDPTLELLTPGTADVFTFLATSADGSRILIHSDEGLTGEPTAGGIFEAGDSGYVFRGAGYVRRISRSLDRVFLNSPLALTPDDVYDEVDAYMSTDDGLTLLTPLDDHGVGVGGGWGDYGAFDATGTRFLINTAGQLTPDDMDTTGDVYLSDHGVRTLVSAGDADASSLTMTEDGRFVVYVTKGALDPLDTDEYYDLYRWDAEAPDHPILLTLGDGYNGADPTAINASGDTILIQSEDPLLPEDTNTLNDLYVWREGTLTLLSTETHTGGRLAFVSTDVRRILMYADNGLAAIDFDLTAPTPTLSPIASSTTSRSATFQAGSVSADAVWFDCRLDGGEWSRCGPKVTLTGLSVGKHKLELRAFDAAANESAAVARSWTVTASTSPSIDDGSPKATMVVGTILAGASVPVRFTWTSSGLASPGDRYELAQRTNGGAWQTVAASAASRSLTTNVSIGYDHQYRVRTIGPSGIKWPWATGPTFRLKASAETSAAIKYTGSWSQTVSTSFWGGLAKSASRAGSKATFTFSGRSVALVSRTGPGRGKAEIWVGSTKVATIDLNATTYTSRRIVWSMRWTTLLTRTVTVKVLGTTGRPRVDIDGFIVGN